MDISCYLCGTTTDLTDDHVPPEGFFPKPKPGNLITVRCCRTCNNGWSKDDDAIRLWISSSTDASPAARWIWRNKVAPSLDGRNRKLVQTVRKYLGTDVIATADGPVILPFLGMPTDRADRFLIRITKGLLRYFHPAFDYRTQPFEIKFLDPTRSADTARFQQLTSPESPLVMDERGNGVFRFWRGVSNAAPHMGIWVYLFYENVCFVVIHGRPVRND